MTPFASWPIRILALTLCLHVGYLLTGVAMGQRSPLSLFWLCYVGESLAVAGFLLRSPLLISASTLPVLVICIAWNVDLALGLAGLPIHDTAPYMCDGEVPFWTRIASLFHITMPVFQIAVLRVVGYRGAALPWSASLMLPLLAVAWWLTAGTEHVPNFLDEDWILPPGPFTGIVSLVAVWAFIVIALMWPAHAALSRWCPGPASSSAQKPG